MQTIMLTCFHSVQHKLENRIGYFELLGFDFMLDSELNVSMIHFTMYLCTDIGVDRVKLCALPGRSG